MVIHSRGLGLDLSSQKFAGHTGARSVARYPSSPSRISTSANCLAAAFSTQCSLGSANGASGSKENCCWRTSLDSSVSSNGGRRYRTYHASLSVGKRNFRQLFLIPPPLRGNIDGMGYSCTIRSLKAQAEGHGLPDNMMLVEDVKENEEQTWSPDRQKGFLATGYGWRVRDASLENALELRRVADIQTKAFHVTAAAFDDLFYKLFHAEVLSSLQYKARHSAPDRYSCLLAEKDPSHQSRYDAFLDNDSEQETVGAVDVTALMDSNIVCLLPGAYEYLYISGMAVDAEYRRRSVATLLLEACVARASDWGFKYLVLHAYEDDVGARNLYSKNNFHVVGADPMWMTKFLGRRRRVVMARRTIEVVEPSS